MFMLFESFTLKDLTLKNRIVLSPMCQYQASNKEGIPENWHLIHLASRAIGGTGLILTEMTNVEARGRITENCLGLYNDAQEAAFKEIIQEVHKYNAKIGIQLAHAGRKSKIQNGDIVAPSAIPFSDDSPLPRALEKDEIKKIIEHFASAAERAVRAGFDTIEIHGAHGYLLHQFMSKSSNKRTDEYGDPTKFCREVIQAVKAVIPANMPLIMRVSAIEYNQPAGYTLEDMVHYCSEFKKLGVDLFDVSTGGNSPNRPKVYPGYQVEYANEIKEKLDVPTISVGSLETPQVAEMVLQEDNADLICIGKGMLKNPYWAKDAAIQLGEDIQLPGVYEQAY
ncbi:NADH:flavin oxidoreductase/NADH oxidase [Oceanobacillus locisalsi]|uniref:NADH:flavin oxidoreductase/NADH oxidase n=1 Tax=Oceanobacillus locisalsi TaxID=546107 RepID=A0ABW3NJD5_9BACI